MKVKHYTEIEPLQFSAGPAKGVAGRVAIGRKEGAETFCMRVFEIAPGGHTPKHVHDWEHEIFIHAGEGEVFGNGNWVPVRPGSAVYVPPNEEHQVRNSGKAALTFICLIPSKAPEL
ncbi:MAG: cupin domain-containing protein [Syntrophales bacterium]|nr:cupin domain-containing protein [Syntrophales bacterium]